jgi:hypothetical protein
MRQHKNLPHSWISALHRESQGVLPSVLPHDGGAAKNVHNLAHQRHTVSFNTLCDRLSTRKACCLPLVFLVQKQPKGQIPIRFASGHIFFSFVTKKKK